MTTDTTDTTDKISIESMDEISRKKQLEVEAYNANIELIAKKEETLTPQQKEDNLKKVLKSITYEKFAPMSKITPEEFLWAERYRPRTFGDVILDTRTSEVIQAYIERKEIPNLLFTSVTPGVGKTSIMKAIAEDLDADIMLVNGSSENRIDTFKVDVKEFVTSTSPMFKSKIVAIDEADGLKLDTQKILRGFVETHSRSSLFIMTCNFQEVIMVQLRDRFATFDFDNIYIKHKLEIQKKIYYRLLWIANREGIRYKNEDIQTIMLKCFPSVRGMIMLMQQFSSTGELIIDDNMMDISNRQLQIIDSLRAKDFTKARKAIQELDNINTFYSYIFENLELFFVSASIPYVVIECAKYQDMHKDARDKTICVSAFAVELMMNPNIKML